MRTEEETTTTFAEDVTFNGCSIPVMKRRRRPNRSAGRGMKAESRERATSRVVFLFLSLALWLALARKPPYGLVSPGVALCRLALSELALYVRLFSSFPGLSCSYSSSGCSGGASSASVRPLLLLACRDRAIVFGVRSLVMLGASLFRVKPAFALFVLFAALLYRGGASMNDALQVSGGNDGAAIANFGTMVFQGNTVFKDTPSVSAASAFL